jgi:hypothetical protein
MYVCMCVCVCAYLVGHRLVSALLVELHEPIRVSEYESFIVLKDSI